MEKISANEFAMLSPTLWEDFVAYLKATHDADECEDCNNSEDECSIHRIIDLKNLSQPDQFIQDLNDEEFGIYKFYKTSRFGLDYIIVWCTWASGYADEWVIGYNLNSYHRFENDDNINVDFQSFLSNEFQKVS